MTASPCATPCFDTLDFFLLFSTIFPVMIISNYITLEARTFLISDIKFSDRVETVLSFITNDESLRTSKNVLIGWKEGMAKLHQLLGWELCRKERQPAP